MRKYPNLIRGFDLERPHRLWVGDITYISLKGGFAYLALITDAYSKRIVGYDLNTTLERDGALRALRMAIDQTPQQKRQGLIHHSDRGCQYCSKEYVKLLTDNGIRISMTEKGDPENAVAERVNGILKSEWIDEECFESFQAAKERIDQIVILYNSLRPHASCDWLTPLEAELRTGKLKHHWGRKTVVRKAYVNLYQDNIFEPKCLSLIINHCKPFSGRDSPRDGCIIAPGTNPPRKPETASYKYSFRLNEELEQPLQRVVLQSRIEQNRSCFIVKRIFRRGVRH